MRKTTQVGFIDWWNPRAGEALRASMQMHGLTPDRIARKSQEHADTSVSAKTIRSWLVPGASPAHRPNAEKLRVVCEILKTSIDDLYVASSEHVRAEQFTHPHARLKADLLRYVQSGQPGVLEFLAPSGFLKTRVLRQLELDFANKKQIVALYIRPADHPGLERFWSKLAEKLTQRGVVIPLDRWSDPFDAVEDSLRRHDCVLLIDDVDKWLLTANAAPETVNAWLSRLLGLSCITIVAGMTSLNHVALITEGPESPNVVLKHSWPRGDGWDGWTSQVCATRQIDDWALLDVLRSAAKKHPTAFICGVGFAADGIGEIKCHIREHHLSIGSTILRQLPERLRVPLMNGTFKSLHPKSRQGRALIDAGVLVGDSAPLRAAIEEWEEAWSATPDA